MWWHVTLILGPVWSPLFQRARTFARIRRFQDLAVNPPCIFASDTLLSPTQPDKDDVLQICSAGCSRVRGALLRLPSVCYSPDQEPDKYESLNVTTFALARPRRWFLTVVMFLQN